MLVVRHDEDLARRRQLGLGQDERARRRERQRDDARERPLEHRAAGRLQQQPVEAFVDVHVAHERVVVGLVDDLLHLVVARAHRREGLAAHAALGREAGRRALEHPAHLDRVVDVGPSEAADSVAAAGQELQQSLVLEGGERQAQRRAGHAETLDERQLRHARPGRELAVEDELPQAQQRSQRL